MGAREKQQNGVTALHDRVTPPNHERSRLIREWHIEQALGQQHPAALLNITLTNNGRVCSAGIAIEPEHALVMLEELDRIRDRLLQYVGAARHCSAAVISFPHKRTA